MRNSSKLSLGALVVSSTFAGAALAEVPVGVTAAITEAATDIGVIGAAVLVVIVAYKVFQWLRRAM